MFDKGCYEDTGPRMLSRLMIMSRPAGRSQCVTSECREPSHVSPVQWPVPALYLCMVLCEKGCFNRYVQDPGSKVAVIM